MNTGPIVLSSLTFCKNIFKSICLERESVVDNPTILWSPSGIPYPTFMYTTYPPDSPSLFNIWNILFFGDQFLHIFWLHALGIGNAG